MERNTAFLYPDLASENQKERRCTLNLITSLTAIVQSANRQLKNLIEGGSFSFVKCMPEVQMHCITEEMDVLDDLDNVRICVTRYDGHDYTLYYDKLTREYVSGHTRISHLVALDLYSTTCHTQFSRDENKQFDAVISTCLETLEAVLVSIMFDISLYHYFLLSDDLIERKKFNEIKYDHLIKNLTDSEKKVYGTESLVDGPIYLPFSLPEVKVINRRTKNENRQEMVKKLLQRYATFLARSTSLKIKKDQKGNIKDSSDSLPQEIQRTVESVLKEHTNSDEYVIVFSSDSTNNLTHQVLEFDESGSLPSWITKDSEKKAFPYIILVEEG